MYHTLSSAEEICSVVMKIDLLAELLTVHFDLMGNESIIVSLVSLKILAVTWTLTKI